MRVELDKLGLYRLIKRFYAAFFFFAFAFFPSDRGRGVTTNLLIFDFVRVL